METQQQQERTFTVTQGLQSEEITGRLNAVEAAKVASSQQPREVVVERTDGAVRMTFFNGSLQSMICETSDRRRRR